MLDKIDDVRWSDLQHAYGAADDVPQLIKALLSPREEDRRKSLRELWSNIFHQGTRYSATLRAIPFLFELLGDPAVADRHLVVYLLVSLAVGCEDEYLPFGFPTSKYRPILAPAPARSSVPRSSESTPSPQIHLACYQCVNANAKIFASLLSDDCEELRIASAYALCWFPACPTALGALTNILKCHSGTSDRELANAMLAYGLLSFHSGVAVDTSLLRFYLDDSRKYVRVAAAIAMAKTTADTHVLQVLSEGAHSNELQNIFETTHFFDGDLMTYAEAVLDEVSTQ